MKEKTKDFDTVLKVVARYEKVTHQDVKDAFDKLFFEQPRRLNYKAYRLSDVPNEEAIKLNQEFYSGGHF